MRPAALVLGICLVAPVSAVADDKRLVDFPEWIDVSELVLPDSRWQWQGLFQGSRLVLSWPAPIALPRLHLHGDSPAGWDLIPMIVAEPQIAFGPRVDWRLNGALRGMVVRERRMLSGLAELLAVHGSDGTGLGFGVGAGLGGGLSLVYRMSFVGGLVRQDLSLDFHVFSLPMSRYLNEVEQARKERPPPPAVQPVPLRMPYGEKPICDPPGCDEDAERLIPADEIDSRKPPVDRCGNGLIGVRAYESVCARCLPGRPCNCGWAPMMEECDGDAPWPALSSAPTTAGSILRTPERRLRR